MAILQRSKLQRKEQVQGLGRVKRGGPGRSKADLTVRQHQVSKYVDRQSIHRLSFPGSRELPILDVVAVEPALVLEDYCKDHRPHMAFRGAMHLVGSNRGGKQSMESSLCRSVQLQFHFLIHGKVGIGINSQACMWTIKSCLKKKEDDFNVATRMNYVVASALSWSKSILNLELGITRRRGPPKTAVTFQR